MVTELENELFNACLLDDVPTMRKVIAKGISIEDLYKHPWKEYNIREGWGVSEDDEAITKTFKTIEEYLALNITDEEIAYYTEYANKYFEYINGKISPFKLDKVFVKNEFCGKAYDVAEIGDSPIVYLPSIILEYNKNKRCIHAAIFDDICNDFIYAEEYRQLDSDHEMDCSLNTSYYGMSYLANFVSNKFINDNLDDIKKNFPEIDFENINKLMEERKKYYASIFDLSIPLRTEGGELNFIIPLTTKTDFDPKDFISKKGDILTVIYKPGETIIVGLDDKEINVDDLDAGMLFKVKIYKHPSDVAPTKVFYFGKFTILEYVEFDYEEDGKKYLKCKLVE